jgi:3-methyladenine DNA glycosylase AlkD
MKGQEYALAWLEKNGSKAGRDGMARYNIPSDKAFGVPMNRIQALAKELGKDHALAEALWKTDRYEARLLAAYVDEPARVTIAQMDRWCRDFDNWGVVDTLCFALFDRTSGAWSRVDKWACDEGRVPEARGVRAALGTHRARQGIGRRAVLKALKLVEGAAADERHFVKKAVNMALRAVGKRSAALNKAAIAVAERLAAAAEPGAAMGRQGCVAGTARSRPGAAAEGALARVADRCGIPATRCRRAPKAI